MDSLNTIPNSGSFGDVSSKLNDNFSKVGQSLTTLENVAIANKGYFDTLASLQAAFPSPKAGNIAYVANAASSTGYYIYNVVAGVWTATSTEAPAVDVAISNYAQHGYSSSPKTLKQVDDEVVQLAGETLDKLIKGWVIAEAMAISNPTYSADGNISGAVITWGDGDIGSISNVVVGQYGITSIRYNRSNGDYATMSVAYDSKGEFQSQEVIITKI